MSKRGIMKTIHRQGITNGHIFYAPRNVTFGWQESRQEFSVWFEAGALKDCLYEVVGTGHQFNDGELVASYVMSDGFHVFHLIRVTK